MGGHLYCRYFADLFGGQMLALPYRHALCLPVDTPRHYTFTLPPMEDCGEKGGRRALIGQVYGSLNEADAMLTDEARDAVTSEATQAFQYNIDVYSEEPIYLDALRGGANMVTGYLLSKIRPS